MKDLPPLGISYIPKLIRSFAVIAQNLCRALETVFVSLRGLRSAPAHVVGSFAYRYLPEGHDITGASTVVSTVQVTGAGIPLTGGSGG